MGTQITGGVDTHLDVHVAAALDEHGGLLGTASFETTPAGYAALVGWLRRSVRWCWSESKAPAATAPGSLVISRAWGSRWSRSTARTVNGDAGPGKSDTHDAVSAARAAFAGDALGAAEDPRRQRRSDPGAAPGSQQRQHGIAPER